MRACVRVSGCGWRLPSHQRVPFLSLSLSLSLTPRPSRPSFLLFVSATSASYRILGVLAVLQLALSTSRGAVGWIAAAHTRRRRARDAAAGGVSAVDAEPIDERVPTAGKEDRAREAGATAAAAANGNGSRCVGVIVVVVVVVVWLYSGLHA